LPPQRFSRSRGFAPPDTCRPCFMPVPSMGFFPFRADFTRRAFGSFEPPSPLVVRWFEKRSASAAMEGCTSGCAFHDSCLVKQRFSDQSHFRVLVPTSVCTPHRLFGPSEEPRPSGFVLPRGFSLFAGGFPESPSSLELHRRSATLIRRLPFRVFCPARGRNGLFRVFRPFRGFPPFLPSKLFA